jgi:hypothetical protein
VGVARREERRECGKGRRLGSLLCLLCFAKMPMPIMGVVFLFHFTANFAFLLTCYRPFTGYYMYGQDVL